MPSDSVDSLASVDELLALGELVSLLELTSSVLEELIDPKVVVDSPVGEPVIAEESGRL